MLIDLALVLGLIALNGLFSATEISVIAMRKTRVSQLVEMKRPGARSVALLRAHTERFLATVQVGITAVGAAAAVYGEDSIGERLENLLSGIPGVTRFAHPLSFVATISTITFLSVVVGELVPKSLALRAPEPVALTLSRPLLWLSKLAQPAVWLLTTASNLILRWFGDKTSFTEARLSPDELQELVEEAARTGDLDDDTADIASRALDLRDLSAENVMQPRTQVAALALGATRHQVLELLERELPDRIPIYQGTIDNLTGYVAVKELACQVLAERTFSLKKLLRPLIYVPPALPAVKLLSRMQRERAPMAVVLDEAGGTKGLVTFEDLLEELVGEVHDDSLVPAPGIVEEANGNLVVRADTPIHELNREHGLELEEGDEWSTLAGLCLELAGRIPEPGTFLRAASGCVLEILTADARAIRSVRVRPPRPAE